VHPEDSPCGSGRGLLLKGDGRGGFSAQAGSASGVRIYGEQRGAAAADFDADGRLDLAVAQNGDRTVLLHNAGAKPGLRVRLAGLPGNPTGIGAVVRLVYGNQPGPAREIHAGSGYWSQDSPVQVLGLTDTPTHLWIRWPGGRITRTEVPVSAREITVATDGALRAAR
jgi:hypothetical protein